MFTFWTWVKWIHVVGAMTWLGGVFFVVFMLRPTLAELPDQGARRFVLSGAVKRMRQMMNPVVTLQVLTGGFLAWRRLDIWDELLSSQWGLLLLAKVLLATGLIGLYVVVPRLLLSGPTPAPGGDQCCSTGAGPTPKQKAGHILHMVMLLVGALVILIAKALAG